VNTSDGASAAAATARPDSARLRQNLRQRVIHAGGWTALGHLAGHALRFGGNLALTRLLFPEAFGLMAIVQAVMLGVHLLSDIGITPSIVQDRRGAEPRFLETAWTFQILRGIALAAALALAAYPVAALYGERELAPLLLAASLAPLVAGFNSIGLALAERALALKRVMALELVSYAAGLGFMLAWAWISPSVWALLWGNVLTAALKMAGSHLLLRKPHRLRLEPQAAGALWRFGKWVLVASGVTFLAGEGMRLVLAALLDLRMLAFFVLASTLNRAALDIVQQVGGRVVFPAYAEIERHRPADLARAVAKARLALLTPLWLAAALLLAAGEPLMRTLYDARYADSGWMLEMLAMGALVGSISASYSGIFLAKGNSRVNAALVACQFGLQLAGVLLGYALNGAQGAIAGLAAAWWFTYPVYAFALRRIGLWQPQIDVPFLAASALAVVIHAYA
jgi:O-antigen/teichoic acid export membrane protein